MKSATTARDKIDDDTVRASRANELTIQVRPRFATAIVYRNDGMYRTLTGRFTATSSGVSYSQRVESNHLH